jgi:transcriptional regulator with XRE-family HTH domain
MLAGKSLPEAARAAQVQPGQVSGWELGYRTPSTDQLQALADCYGMELETLLGALGYRVSSSARSVRDWYASRNSLARGANGACAPGPANPEHREEPPRLANSSAGMRRALVGARA